jgi:hypothetical protein
MALPFEFVSKSTSCFKQEGPRVCHFTVNFFENRHPISRESLEGQLTPISLLPHQFHSNPQNQERTLNLSILLCLDLVSFPVLSQSKPQAPIWFLMSTRARPRHPYRLPLPHHQFILLPRYFPLLRAKTSRCH